MEHDATLLFVKDFFLASFYHRPSSPSYQECIRPEVSCRLLKSFSKLSEKDGMGSLWKYEHPKESSFVGTSPSVVNGKV
jgi:hypothetical protein